MRASEFITESLLSKGAEFLIQLLKGGKKSTPKPVTVDQRIVYDYRVTNFGGKRLYATPQQAENLDSLAKSAADIRAMIQRLESRGGGATVWRNDLKEVESAIEQLMKEISKNKKMDVSPHSLESLDEGWSKKYKRSINCNNPKGFSQKAHCAGRKKKESIEETIRKQGDKYVIYSKDGSKKLGTYDSRKAAEKRLGQIEYFKHAGK